MRAYTIVVDESLDQALPGDMPPFPGVVVEGGSPEGCVERGREAIVLYLADLALAGQEQEGRLGTANGEDEADGLADEEAMDALRRAGAALDTVQAEILAELVRRQDPASQADLRRVHVALLRARAALTDADSDQPASAGPAPQMTRRRAAVDLAQPRSPGDGIPPVAELAFRRYTGLAPAYDALTDWAAAYRSRAVDELGLRAGDTVVDVGCGTGLNFSSIQDRIGPSGLLIGIDQCPAMLAKARARADRAGWDNLVLVCSPIERAVLPAPPDAVLFCAVHDILRSPLALHALIGQVPEGSRVVAAGAKWVPWWVPAAPVVNSSVWAVNEPYVSTFEGFDRPWSHLAGLLSGLTVRELAFGSFYLASGTTGP